MAHESDQDGGIIFSVHASQTHTEIIVFDRELGRESLGGEPSDYDCIGVFQALDDRADIRPFLDTMKLGMLGLWQLSAYDVFWGEVADDYVRALWRSPDFGFDR